MIVDPSREDVKVFDPSTKPSDTPPKVIDMLTGEILDKEWAEDTQRWEAPKRHNIPTVKRPNGK